MITDLRVVQNHGWINTKNGPVWGPSNYWIEVMYEGSDDWVPAMIHYINKDPVVDSSSSNDFDDGPNGTLISG